MTLWGAQWWEQLRHQGSHLNYSNSSFRARAFLKRRRSLSSLKGILSSVGEDSEMWCIVCYSSCMLLGRCKNIRKISLGMSPRRVTVNMQNARIHIELIHLEGSQPFPDGSLTRKSRNIPLTPMQYQHCAGVTSAHSSMLSARPTSGASSVSWFPQTLSLLFDQLARLTPNSLAVSRS